MEYQLGLGGSISTKSELSKEWTSLFFRPYSKLYRGKKSQWKQNWLSIIKTKHINYVVFLLVRTDFITSEVVMVENCTMQKINTEAMTQYEYKPHQRLGVMYKIFIELSKLCPGNYLLRHVPKQGPFVAVLKECSEK